MTRYAKNVGGHVPRGTLYCANNLYLPSGRPP